MYMNITKVVSYHFVFMFNVDEYYCAVVEMGRTAKYPHRLRSCDFTLVRDAKLKKVDSNTRKVHSQFSRHVLDLQYVGAVAMEGGGQQVRGFAYLPTWSHMGFAALLKTSEKFWAPYKYT